MGRLDVELELIPSDTTPFRVKLRRFHNESKE